MEPASLPVAKGRGSIEDPEVLENVPGQVIPILEREFDDFDTESAKFLRGETEETEFIKFRLKQGVYGQRQAAVQMVRVKLPFGGVTPDQMDAFADAIERWVPLNKGHITTRQNIQVHHVPLDDARRDDGEGALLAAHLIPEWVDKHVGIPGLLEGYADEAARDESRAWVALMEGNVHAALVRPRSPCAHPPSASDTDFC